MTGEVELERIRAMVPRVEAAFPGARVELEVFPSGAAMLDVRLSERMWVLAFTPAGGFGVDEVGPEDAFDTGYRFVSRDFAAAEKQMYALLEGARAG